MDVWGKSVPGRRSSKCKGPEVTVNLVRSGNSKAASRLEPSGPGLTGDAVRRQGQLVGPLRSLEGVGLIS